MAVIPFSETVSQSPGSDGSRTITVAITDGNGATVLQMSHTAPAGTRPLDAVAELRRQAHNVLADRITWADLPSSYTVQIGLDTTMRELDLL